jgi:hypothetical protein
MGSDAGAIHGFSEPISGGIRAAASNKVGLENPQVNKPWMNPL